MSVRGWITLALCATLLGTNTAIGAGANVGTASAAARMSAPNPAFKVVLPLLRRTHVPPVLPSYLPFKLYGALQQGLPGYYEVILGYVPNCNGHACEFGYIYGQRNGKAPAAADVPLTLAGASVRLAHGLHGHFVPFTCGANCDDSMLTWQQHGFRYAVGVKAGSKAEVVKIANSAILTSSAR